MYTTTCRIAYIIWSLLHCSSTILVRAEEEVTCTHGKLFLSDTASSMVHVIDLNLVEPIANLVVETSITVEGSGSGDIDLHRTADGKTIAALYGGSADMNYTDGVVNFIHSGVELVNHGDHSDVSFGTPMLLPNGSFRCARAVHFEPNNGNVAIFCDGSYSGLINSTVWVVDESALESGESPTILYNATLLGSHHGVAIPVFENHLLYSVASPDRINRSANGSDDSLPSHFNVIEIPSGAIIHQLNDSTSVDTHCSGYHGSTYFDNTVLLACDEVHGGILIVNYTETLDAYSSRALTYPSSSNFDGHRAAHFEKHAKSDYVIGDFTNGEDSFGLIAFQATDTTLADMNVLPMSTLQCGFGYENSEGEVILVLMPDGMLLAYEFESDMGWIKVAELLVVDGMSACSEALFVVGYVHAFVITYDNPTIYAIDLHHVHEGELTYTTSSINFIPNSAVVGGVPPLVACTIDATTGHDHDHDDHGDDKPSNTGNNTTKNATTSSVSTISTSVVTTFLIVAVIFSIV